LFQRIFGLGEKPSAPPQVPITQTAPQLTQPVQPSPQPNAPVAQAQPQEPQPAKKKKGFFSRLFGKKNDDTNQQQPAPQPNPPPPPQ
jgi:penicillin-binding protein 1B